MPRGPRLDSPGLLHHVWFRGVERRAIFVDDLDREEFCCRLESVCSEGRAEVLAWCLMDNHVHLAIRCLSCSLASVMRRLLTGYAMWFNKRHGRVGHLFQNRYKSTVVDSEQYLCALVRYIHLNPVAAGLVKNSSALEDYAWCGHAGLMGQAARGFQQVEEVLGRFGNSCEQARAELSLFMGDRRAANGEASTFGGGGLKRSVGGAEALSRLREDVRQGHSEGMAHDARVLGTSEVVLELLALEERTRQQVRLSPERRVAAFEQLLERVTQQSGITPAELLGAGRRRPVVAWRRITAYLTMTKLGASAAETGRLLGLSTVAILKAVAHAPRLVEKMKVDVPSLLA